MAELLIKAQEPWNNDSDISKMTKEELARWNARSRKGDIIVVRPDGWKWGKEECPPRFIVVKLPRVAMEDVKHYEEPLTEEVTETKTIDGKSIEVKNQVMLKVRKHCIDIATVEDCAKETLGIKEISQVSFASKLTAKTATDAKAELASFEAEKI